MNSATISKNHELRTGMLGGFTSAADLVAYPCVVTVDGLCRDQMGDFWFRLMLNRLRRAAVRLAPCAHRVDAIHAAGARTGYTFRFADEKTAVAFRFCVADAKSGRRCLSLR